MDKGLVYIFTGEGKGKTSAALGVAVRAALISNKVCWISYYKGKEWELAEKSLPEHIPNLEMHWAGKGFYITEPEQTVRNVKIASVGKGKVIDKATVNEHQLAAHEGLKLAEQKINSGEYWLIVLDEIMNAMSEGLLEEKEVLNVVKSRGSTHLVLTGRGVAQEIIDEADLVTECKKIKHPYDAGKLAVRGLDF